MAHKRILVIALGLGFLGGFSFVAVAQGSGSQRPVGYSAAG